jgi:Arc/MetJ-type ribon-helix-helix transcriptional regulator
MNRDEKKTNRVTVFLTDALDDFLNERTYALGMDNRAEYVRKLLVEDMRRLLREHASECERKQRQLDASGHSGVGADLRGVGRNVIERDSEWPDTVQTR